MNFEEYTDFTDSTAIYPPERELEYLALGLAGEAGEVAGKVSKVIRDSDGTVDALSAYKIACELGDVLWFLARLTRHIGYTVDDLIDVNVEKLSERKERNVLQGDGDTR